MKRVKILIRAFFLVCVAVTMTGCMAHTSKLTIAGPSVYHLPVVEGAPKIVFSDLRDLRSDKKTIGQISALSLKADVDINIALTDKIAGKLRDKGFNVQKVNFVSQPDNTKITEILKSNDGTLYISGGLSEFFISSFDAVMESAKGNTNFYIVMYNKNGQKVFDESFSSISENWIGLTGGMGADKSIRLALDASAEELFKDKKFNQLLEQYKK